MEKSDVFPTIPVMRPYYDQQEKSNVAEVVASGNVSSGDFMRWSESLLSEMFNGRSVVLCSSGTGGLHLAVRTMGIGPGDEVIIPALTCVATANAVKLAGAKPVIVDVSDEDGLLCYGDMRDSISENTKAIIPVHLYGKKCNTHWFSGFRIIEDSCQSIVDTGCDGDIAVLSFSGNKWFGCGQGGAVICSNESMANQVRMLMMQAVSNAGDYWHYDFGFNYRMTNLQAAVLYGQIAKKQFLLDERKRIRKYYLNKIGTYMMCKDDMKTVFWMNTVYVKDAILTRKKMAQVGIETRPMFYPLNRLPHLSGTKCDNAWWLYHHAISIPTFPGIKEAEMDRVVESIEPYVTALGEFND